MDVGPPAVVAAIHDATGVWIPDLPASPERILAALHGITPPPLPGISTSPHEAPTSPHQPAVQAFPTRRWTRHPMRGRIRSQRVGRTTDERLMAYQLTGNGAEARSRYRACADCSTPCARTLD